MRILYYECFSGISGDMNLGLMIDLGVDFDYLTQELKKLGVDEEYELIKKTGSKLGITGTKVDVILKNEDDHSHEHDHKQDHHDHDHDHEHDHHEHDHHDHEHDHHDHAHHKHDHHDHHDHKHDHHDHKHDHSHGHNQSDHVHRGYKDIERIIMNSGLKDSVKALSLDIFMRIAVAEGKVHGKPYDEVHFHEVGATDSIVDIVGSAICLDALGVDAVWSSTVELGGGFVKCAHGLMPVPAPATVEIMKGAKTKTGRVQKETTTPTGAAILAATVTKYTDSVAYQVEKVGYGLGTRDMEIPNVVRGTIASVVSESKERRFESDTVVEIQANIDDMKAEYMDLVLDLLYENGALEVYQTAVMMKKGRNGTLLTVICNKTDHERLSSLILTHTTAIGCRFTEKNRYKLRRETQRLRTKYGEVDVKVVYDGDDRLRYKAEYDQLKSLAKENNVTLEQLEKEVIKCMEANNE